MRRQKKGQNIRVFEKPVTFNEEVVFKQDVTFAKDVDFKQNMNVLGEPTMTVPKVIERKVYKDIVLDSRWKVLKALFKLR